MEIKLFHHPDQIGTLTEEQIKTLVQNLQTELSITQRRLQEAEANLEEENAFHIYRFCEVQHLKRSITTSFGKKAWKRLYSSPNARYIIDRDYNAFHDLYSNLPTPTLSGEKGGNRHA